MVFVGLGDEKSYGSTCSVFDDQLMKCATPPVPGRDSDKGQMERITEYVFDFDGAELHRSRIKVMPSPSFELLTDPRFVRPGEDFLTLNGNHLNLAATERDITVTVGGEPCPLTALANKVLTCQPPVRKPAAVGKLNPEIVVSVGNATFSVGEVSYDSPGVSSSLFLIISIFIMVMIGLIVCLIVLYRRKTNSHQRQMKYLKTQMDTIEMKVATECKEAFAELQTSLNQYTADLPLGTPTAPFLEYKDYCARDLLIFPD
uniref:IPT/TIG domain-containing protein n=1 Tax=Caenorhabditis japonica TaxID=281687 RepID=A0A8R1ES79_CAEJA